MLYDPTFWEIIKGVSKKLNISEDVVAVAYRTQFQFIKERLGKYPDLFKIDEEEFKKLRTSFNLPILGKFYIKWERIQKVKERINERDKVKKD